MTDYAQPVWLRTDPVADARFPAIGFCPCPGNQMDATHVADIVRRTARALHDIADVLNGTGRGAWKGKTAETFREQFHDDFRPKVNDARDSFSDAAEALENWARYMRDHQRYAEQLEGEAQDAKDRAAGLQRALDRMPPKPGFLDVSPGKTSGEKEEQERQEARRSGKEKLLHTANADLEAVRGRAERLRERYVEEGETVADRLKHAMDIAPNEPGVWDKIAQAIVDLAEKISELQDAILKEVKEALKELAPLLQFIGDIAGFASTVLGLLSLIPGLQFLALPALILGGIGLASHYLSAVGTTGSFLSALTDPTVITDAVTLACGVAAFGAGLKLSKMAGAAGSYPKLAAQTMKLGKAGPDVPGYFRFASQMGPGGMRTPEFAYQFTQFTTTVAGNFMGLVPGGGADALQQIGQGKAPDIFTMPKLPNFTPGTFPTPTGPLVLPNGSF
ncbi:putative T7SS-secreted protein [Streptomyces sp. NPDC000994]